MKRLYELLTESQRERLSRAVQVERDSDMTATGKRDFEAWATRVSGRPVRAYQPPSPEHRRAAWERIQRDAPELAEFMGELREEFGRVRLLEAEVGGEKFWP